MLQLWAFVSLTCNNMLCLTWGCCNRCGIHGFMRKSDRLTVPRTSPLKMTSRLSTSEKLLAHCTMRVYQVIRQSQECASKASPFQQEINRCHWGLKSHCRFASFTTKRHVVGGLEELRHLHAGGSQSESFRALITCSEISFQFFVPMGEQSTSLGACLHSKTMTLEFCRLHIEFVLNVVCSSYGLGSRSFLRRHRLLPTPLWMCTTFLLLHAQLMVKDIYLDSFCHVHLHLSLFVGNSYQRD